MSIKEHTRKEQVLSKVRQWITIEEQGHVLCYKEPADSLNDVNLPTIVGYAHQCPLCACLQMGHNNYFEGTWETIKHI